MANREFVAMGLWLAVAAGPVHAAEPARLVGQSRRTAERLDEIADLLRKKEHSKAIEMSLRLIEQTPQEWVPVDQGRRFVSVREFLLDQVHAQESTGRLFRERYESKAADLLRRAQAHRDTRLLHEIITELTPTKAASQALEVLGDWQFENGDFSAARHSWRQAAQRVDAKRVPAVRAKIVLATAACREPTDELRANWRQEFPEADGQLAGQAGRLADILDEVMTRFSAPEPKSRNFAAWPSDRLGRWTIAKERITLPGRPPMPFNTPTQTVQRPNVSTDQLTLRPIIWRDYFVTADGPRISAIQLTTGKLADVYSIGDNNRDGNSTSESPLTITTDGNRVIARMGATKNEPGGIIACLDPDPNADEFRWRVVWQIAPKMLADTGTIVLGATPVARDGHIYFTWTQTIGSRRVVWITSYATDRITEGPRWSVPVVEEIGDADTRSLQPLTLAGPNVVYVTNAGLIVAVNEATGRPAWATSYNSHSAGQFFSRKRLAETLVSNGRLLVAPADSREFWALEVWTGQPVWPRPQPLAVQQILGVIANQVVVTVDGQWRGLAAINAINGKIEPHWGSLTAASPYGRGVIVDDRILFPTRHAGVAAVNHRGEPVFMPATWQIINGGNIVFDRETAVIAGAGELTILRFERAEVAKND